MSIFPTAVATRVQLLTAANNAMAVLDVDCDIDDAILTVDDTSALPDAGYLTFVDTDEVIYYTAKTGTTLTGVTRGADDTAPAAHLAGVDLELRWNAAFHNVLGDEVGALETLHSAQLGRVSTQIAAPLGTAGTPGISFAGDVDTGFLQQNLNELEICIGGQTRVYMDTTQVNASIPYQSSASGTNSAPQYSWSTDSDCGLYRVGTNNIALAAGGTKVLDVNAAGVGIGGAPGTKAILALTSTTLGFLPPVMTTTQRDAITSPTEGLTIYNSTTHRLNVYQGSSWREVHLATETDIVNADVNASAAIAYSKLSLTGGIVNADVSASAAIVYSKLSLGTSIVNADIATAAAIAYSKLAALTTSRAVQTNASTGILEVSSVTNTELGYLSGVTSAIQTQLNAVGFPINLADNAGLEIWQRGTSFSNPANNTYCADRWLVSTNEASTVTVSRESTTKDTGEYSHKVVLTGSGASKFWQIVQYVENYKEFSGKTVTVSMRVWSNVASSIKVGIASTSTVKSSYHTGGSGWETLTATITCPSPAIELLIFVGGLDSGDKKNGTWYVDSVMLGIGSAVTFVPLHPAVDMTRCQHYFYRITGHAATDEAGIGFVLSTTHAYYVVKHPVEMRTAPTATVTGATGFKTMNAAATGVALTALSAGNITTFNMLLDATVASGLVAGNATRLYDDAGAASYIDVSADL